MPHESRPALSLLTVKSEFGLMWFFLLPFPSLPSPPHHFVETSLPAGLACWEWASLLWLEIRLRCEQCGSTLQSSRRCFGEERYRAHTYPFHQLISAKVVLCKWSSFPSFQDCIKFRQKNSISSVSHVSQYFQKGLALLSASPLGDLSLQHFYGIIGVFFPMDWALKE